MLLAVPVTTGAQSLDVNRLRRENEVLRAQNDSLRRRLLLTLPEADPWGQLSGLDDDSGLPSGDVSSIDALYVLLASPSMELEYQDVIRKYIERYLSSLGGHTSAAMGRYSHYSSLFIEEFDRFGVPEELTTLSIVESAVSATAVSVAGAAGVWQLMPATARAYGLRVDDDIDERFDVAKSTRAAARYLSDMYKSFGSWPLVVMGYNCGAGAVRRAIVRNGGADNPWEVLADLPAETRAYLPSLLAINYIRKFGGNDGFREKPYSRAATHSFRMERDMSVSSLVTALGMDSASIRRLNPFLVGDMVPEGCVISVPAGRRKEAESIFNKSK